MRKHFLPCTVTAWLLFTALQVRMGGQHDFSSPFAPDIAQVPGRAPVPTPGIRGGTTGRDSVSVRAFGAVGDGHANDIEAIRQAIKFAQANKIATVYFPSGTYLIGEVGTAPGMVRLANGVNLKGTGPATCTLKLAGGLFNPEAMFFQAWWQEPEVSNVLVEGLAFDGNLGQQRFAANYQYCHALSINNGHNIEVRRCKFVGFRGDGLLFGDTDEPSRDARITRNVQVHDNEFDNIYREGCMFCCTEGGSFYRNRVHGPGYLVGGVDIERHSANETVKNIQVHHNVFDFREGYGPVERGGPHARYRRAVTMGFFYAGYPGGMADGRSGGHRIYGNAVYQGQVDCYGHTDVSIDDNTFSSAFEDVAGVTRLTPHAILVADARRTTGLSGVRVTNNVVCSQMAGDGIVFNNYSGASAASNHIANVRLAGIHLINASVEITKNTIADVGTAAAKSSGILLTGNCNKVLIAHNTIRCTRSGSQSPTRYAVQLENRNASPVAPTISYNEAVNMANGLVGEYTGQPGFAVVYGNKSSGL